MAPNPERKRVQPANAPKRKRGRPRKSDAEPRRTQSSLRESWGSTTGRRTTVGEDERPSSSKKARASDASRRSSQGAGVIGRRGIPQPNQPGSSLQRTATARGEDNNNNNNNNNNKNMNNNDVEVSQPPLPSPEKPYVHVAPHTRRVRQSAIEAKWTPLTNASLTAVESTLQYAQRPILQRLADSEVRREHTASAVRQVAQRIARKISRGLPFPPASMPANVGRAPLQSDAGREVELNFESVLDGKLTLERQLEPALDALDVLRREKEAMEEELEHDYETLRNLEAGARAQAREQRSLLKKAHLLTPAPSVKREDGGRDPRDTGHDGFMFSRDAGTTPGSAFTGIRDDDEIHPLAMQLGDHVNSIRENLEQTEGILPSVARSRALLRAVLLKHVDQRLYEQAVLG
ncbi:hypothetical protein ED733_007588 [Metarhizium rileyi]|uniref:Kinetochore protein fta7 n=1 Tax=Metarhizium rileyi (strain RCEF 4871) TaxID=1649241 RepID=A0A5C6GPD0_METRR|nr:hypothetical protein ED733_007588 [Metarhizium rileyi]